MKKKKNLKDKTSILNCMESTDADEEACRKLSRPMGGQYFEREKNELWSDFMNIVYYPADEYKKKVMLNRMLISYWQMHGKKLGMKEGKLI